MNDLTLNDILGAGGAKRLDAAGIAAAGGALIANVAAAINFAAFGPANDGSADVKTALRSAIASAQAGNYRRVKVPPGRYLVNIAGDADSIVIPDNVFLDCDEGATFVYSYWGSPLFAAVNRRAPWGIVGATIEWGGTFGTTSGSRNAFGYGAAIPSYEWCTHIAAVGSDFGRITDITTKGTTTANRQNSLLNIRPRSDGVTPVTNWLVENILCDDVSQGITAGGVKDFLFRNIRQFRYANDSGGLYGPGHIIYMIDSGSSGLGVPSQYGRIENISDYAEDQLSSYVTGSHTLSLKNVADVEVSGLFSRRPEGALNIRTATRVRCADIDYYSSSVTADAASGAIYFPSTRVNGTYYVNTDVELRGRIRIATGRNFGPINMGGMADGFECVRLKGDLEVTHDPSGSESVATLVYVGINGDLRLLDRNTSIDKNQVTFAGNSTTSNNVIDLKFSGNTASQAGPRIAFGSGNVNNTVRVHVGSVFNFSPDGFDPADANGNKVTLVTNQRSIGLKVSASSQSPAFTIQLPNAGSYDFDVTVFSADKNHAYRQTFSVAWGGGGGANLFAVADATGTARQIGSNVSSVACAVSNTGLVTISATTVTTEAFSMKYGYTQKAGF